MTIEDGLAEDLVEYWRANRPVGLPEDWNIYRALTSEERVHPYVVIGHEGCEREKAKGMDNTGKVALRVMPVSDMDQTDPLVHRQVVGVMEAAVRKIADDGLQPLTRTFVHAFLRLPAKEGLDERREFTQQSWTAVVSRYV